MRRDEVETRVRREMQLGQGLGPTMRHPVPLAPRFSRFRHFPGQRSFWQRWFARSTAKNRHNTESTGYRSILVVSRVRFSNEDDLTPAVKAAFVQSLQGVQSPIAVEVIFDRAILIQFVGAPKDIALVRAQLAAHFPHAEIVPTPDALPDLAVIRAYGLRDSHFFMLEATPPVDPTLSLFVEDLSQAVMQLLLVPLHGYRENLLQAAADPFDPTKPFFMDLPHLPKAAMAKSASPLFAASLRIGASEADHLDRLEGYVHQFTSAGNALVLLRHTYPFRAIPERAAYAPGMILNALELAALLPFPSPGVRTRTLERGKGPHHLRPLRPPMGLCSWVSMSIGERTPRSPSRRNGRRAISASSAQPAPGRRRPSCGSPSRGTERMAGPTSTPTEMARRIASRLFHLSGFPMSCTSIRRMPSFRLRLICSKPPRRGRGHHPHGTKSRCL